MILSEYGLEDKAFIVGSVLGRLKENRKARLE